MLKKLKYKIPHDLDSPQRMSGIVFLNNKLNNFLKGNWWNLVQEEDF